MSARVERRAAARPAAAGHGYALPRVDAVWLTCAQRDDLELGRLGTIQVHKQTETIQHVDVRHFWISRRSLTQVLQWGTSAHDSVEDAKYRREPGSTIHESAHESP